eukprot:1160176-Pelagomonas_calceolata.AAC.17
MMRSSSSTAACAATRSRHHGCNHPGRREGQMGIEHRAQVLSRVQRVALEKEVKAHLHKEPHSKRSHGPILGVKACEG